MRVALLGIDIAAASNTDTPDAIHGMIDRYKQAALPFSGPSLVSDYYRRVPLGSIVWTIARPPAQASDEHGELLLPGDWSGLLPHGSIVIASARPLKDVHLRADVVLHSEAEAQIFTEQVAAYLTLFKSLEISMDSGGPDKDVKAAFDSLEVHQDSSEAVLTATVPYAFFKKVLSESPVELGPETQKPPKQEAPAAAIKLRKLSALIRDRGFDSRLARPFDASHLGEGGAQEFVGIDRCVVDANFVVQMGPGAASGEAT